MSDLMSDCRPGVAAFAARNPIFALRSKYPTSRMPRASAYSSRGQLLGRALLQNSSERRAFGLLRGGFARLLLLVEAWVADAVKLAFTFLWFAANTMQTATATSTAGVPLPLSQWWFVGEFT